MGTVLYYFTFICYHFSMRRARLTYQGAFHHCMNRGHGGEMIFSGEKYKRLFLETLEKWSQRLKIRILAYCLMDNHYHLVIENSSGRMADFFKQINGEYGTVYRRLNGGKGYVFQGRYQSTVIQDEGYLLMVIAYVLANPVRSGLVADFEEYSWSSFGLYFQADPPDWLDCQLVESLYGTRRELVRHVRAWQIDKKSLPVMNTELGRVIATEEGLPVMRERFDRRSGRESVERKRGDDFGFEPIAKIFQEFSGKYDLDTEKLDYSTHRGKRYRWELLVYLKERGGLKYRELAMMPEFSDVKMSSLGKMYSDGKKWLTKKVK